MRSRDRSGPRADASRGDGGETVRSGNSGEDRESIVRAKGVVKTYVSGESRVRALDGTDLDVVRGEMVGVVGPSGSGKTTLLNCLSGLDDIDEGEVWIGGRDLHALSDRERTDLRSQEMGFIFQAFNLVPVFSALENVELPLLLQGVSVREARDRASDALDQVGLGDRLHHRPAQLSGGEQQRVAIARALAPEPAIVWSDEPTGNLDSDTADQVMDVLHGLNERGLTVVLVTHDTSILDHVDRVLTMRDGVISKDQGVS